MGDFYISCVFRTVFFKSQNPRYADTFFNVLYQNIEIEADIGMVDVGQPNNLGSLESPNVTKEYEKDVSSNIMWYYFAATLLWEYHCHLPVFSLLTISTVHSKIRENLHEIKKKVLSKILSNPIFGCHWSFQFDNIFQSAVESYRLFFIGQFYCPLQDFWSNLLGEQFHTEWLDKI